MGDDGDADQPRQETPELTLKDYLALAIAALETILLPLIVMIVILVALTLIYAGHL